MIRGVGGFEDSTHRLRAALAVLIIAMIVLLTAMGTALLRGPSASGEQASPVSDDKPADATPAVAEMDVLMPVMIGLTIVLVVTLLVASYALFRLTRRLAVPAAPAPQRKPTATESVWQMNRLPDEPVDEPDEP